MEMAGVFFGLALIGLLALLIDFFVEGVFLKKEPGKVADACTAMIAVGGVCCILTMVIHGLTH